MSLLLHYGADRHAKDMWGKQPADHAAAWGHDACVKLLLENEYSRKFRAASLAVQAATKLGSPNGKGDQVVVSPDANAAGGDGQFPGLPAGRTSVAGGNDGAHGSGSGGNNNNGWTSPKASMGQLNNDAGHSSDQGTPSSTGFLSPDVSSPEQTRQASSSSSSSSSYVNSVAAQRSVASPNNSALMAKARRIVHATVSASKTTTTASRGMSAKQTPYSRPRSDSNTLDLVSYAGLASPYQSPPQASPSESPPTHETTPKSYNYNSSNSGPSSKSGSGPGSDLKRGGARGGSGGAGLWSRSSSPRLRNTTSSSSAASPNSDLLAAGLRPSASSRSASRSASPRSNRAANNSSSNSGRNSPASPPLATGESRAEPGVCAEGDVAPPWTQSPSTRRGSSTTGSSGGARPTSPRFYATAEVRSPPSAADAAGDLSSAASSAGVARAGAAAGARAAAEATMWRGKTAAAAAAEATAEVLAAQQHAQEAQEREALQNGEANVASRAIHAADVDNNNNNDDDDDDGALSVHEFKYWLESPAGSAAVSLAYTGGGSNGGGQEQAPAQVQPGGGFLQALSPSDGQGFRHAAASIRNSSSGNNGSNHNNSSSSNPSGASSGASSGVGLLSPSPYKPSRAPAGRRGGQPPPPPPPPLLSPLTPSTEVSSSSPVAQTPNSAGLGWSLAGHLHPLPPPQPTYTSYTVGASETTPKSTPEPISRCVPTEAAVEVDTTNSSPPLESTATHAANHNAASDEPVTTTATVTSPAASNSNNSTSSFAAFLERALLTEHASGLQREGFREAADLRDAEDDDLVSAGLKKPEIRRLRRYLDAEEAAGRL